MSSSFGRRKAMALVVIVALCAAFMGGSAWGENPFTDIGGQPAHANNIDAIYDAGITAGCSQGPTFYCPGDNVTRAQMASFLARLGGLSSGTTKNFPKVNAKGELASYCAMAQANPNSFPRQICFPSETVLATGIGADLSVAVGIDGLPVISYHLTATKDLMFARCRNTACTQADTITLVGAEGDAGLSNAITIGRDGYPYIAYYDETGANDDVRLIRCLNAACTSRSSYVVDSSSSNIGLDIEMVTNPDTGDPVVSYYDVANTKLRVTRCLDPECSGKTPFDVDTLAAPGTSSLAITAGGAVVMSYLLDSPIVGITRCLLSDCSNRNTKYFDPFPVEPVGSTAVAIGTDDIPFAMVNNGADVIMYRCSDFSCTSTAPPQSFSSGGDPGEPYVHDVVINSNGFPMLTFYDFSENRFVFTRCRTLTCSQRSNDVIGSDGLVGNAAQIALGIDGTPLIVYYSSETASLVTARAPMINSFS